MTGGGAGEWHWRISNRSDRWTRTGDTHGTQALIVLRSFWGEERERKMWINGIKYFRAYLLVWTTHPEEFIYLKCLPLHTSTNFNEHLYGCHFYSTDQLLSSAVEWSNQCPSCMFFSFFGKMMNKLMNLIDEICSEPNHKLSSLLPPKKLNLSILLSFLTHSPLNRPCTTTHEFPEPPVTARKNGRWSWPSPHSYWVLFALLSS